MKELSAGIIHNDIAYTLSMPRDFIEIGRRLGLPEATWDCLVGGRGASCDNSFFLRFDRSFGYDIPMTMTAIVWLMCLAICVSTVFTEVAIAYRPSLLRCRCYFNAVKRWCPCPKGTDVEIRALPPAFWDRYRLWMYLLTALYFVIAAVEGLLKALIIRAHLSWREIPTKIGTGYVIATCAMVMAMLLAAMCIAVRLSLNTRWASWAEQQQDDLEHLDTQDVKHGGIGNTTTSPLPLYADEDANSGNTSPAKVTKV
jgi:hypothetical protein